MTLPRLFLLFWFTALTAVVGPLLALDEMSFFGGWRTILPWSLLASAFAFFLFVVPMLLGLRQALRGNFAWSHFALAGAILGVVLTAAVLLFWGGTDIMIYGPSLYSYGAFAVVGAIAGFGFARLPVASLQAARWWWPPRRTLAAAPVVGFATSLVGLPLAAGRPGAMLALAVTTASLLAMTLALGTAALISGKGVSDPVTRHGVQRDVSVSAILLVVWLLTHRIGTPQVASWVIRGMRVPTGSRNVSAGAAFGPFPVEGGSPLPYHWCTARAYAPGLVVVNRGVMRGGLDGDGETVVVLWVLGFARELCVVRQWVS